MEAVPITKKYLLSPDEASALSGLPANLLRFYGKLAKDDNNFSFPCSWAGSHLKINRIGLERWLLERADGHFDFTKVFLVIFLKKPLTTSKTCYIIKLKLNKKHLLGGESVIREKLVAYRGKRSQKEMAKLYNVSQQAWNGWELGLYAPKPSIMKKIENDSGICMEELFFDVFNKQ